MNTNRCPWPESFWRNAPDRPRRDLIDEIMFAGYVESVESRLADDLIGIVEFLGLRQVGNVAGVDHEGGRLR